MNRRILGKTGLSVSELGFGGAEIGFTPGMTVEKTREILALALDSGLNIIDTAAAYMESEKLIGEALGARRKDVIISTKCGALDGFSRSDWSKAGILSSIERSLTNLKTDVIDIVLLHSCGHLEFLWGEAAAGLQLAREKGMVKFIGYSGDGASALAAIESDLFDVLETSVNIADQESISLLLPKAVERNLGVIAKRPLANAAWRYRSIPENSYHRAYYERLQRLDYPFLSQPSGAAVALRFTLSQPGVHTAIVGTTNPGRWQENATYLAEGPLPETEISKIYSRWQERSGVDWVGQV